MLKDYIDSYTMKARVLPAVALLLPVGLMAWFLFPSLFSGFTALAMAIPLLGFCYVIGHFVRAHGQAVEQSLYKLWGGKPTTILQRWSDGRIPEVTKARQRANLSIRLPDLRWPSREDEQKDPKKADQIYGSAADYLREQSRNSANANKLVAEELADYGFRRNLYGVRRLALLLGSLGLIVIGAGGAGLLELAATELPPTWPAAIVALVAHVASLALGVTPDWVRKQADEYALRLLATSEALGPLKSDA